MIAQTSGGGPRRQPAEARDNWHGGQGQRPPRVTSCRITRIRPGSDDLDLRL
jgi:hypothetical protein